MSRQSGPNLKELPARAWAFLAIQRDNPELLKAQCIALSRQIPLMYFILVANSWVLSVTFINRAPSWLTVDASLLLTIVCAVRIAIWWHMRAVPLTVDRAIRELRRTNQVAALLGLAFPIWALALFPHGNDMARAHVAFFMMISLLGSMFCLIHVRSAAVILAAIPGVTFVGFFAATGTPIFIGMAVNVLLVLTASVIIVLIQSRDFERMVNAQTEARRREEEQNRLLRMIDDMPVAVMTVDPQTFNINYVNETSKHTLKQIETLLPIKADALLGTSIDVFHIRPEHQRQLLASPENLPHHARIRLGPEVLDLQISAVNATDGSYIGPMLSWSIVTQQVEAENRIRQLAHFDTLTGLANRTTFREELEAALARPDGEVGLLFIDLDGFKIINDSKGHLVGDALLKEVATRLCRQCDQAGTIVGRLGGDEFAILLTHSDIDQARALAATLVDLIAAPYQLEMDRRFQIGASIGVAVAPLHGADAETLLSHADIALYSAKAAGKGTYRMFSPDMEARIQERVRLETRLRTALEDKDGLFVFYQPIVDIRTGRITAREALLRWHQPQRGWIPPGEFIPVAEASGLIEQLGRFVLNRACRDAAGWDDGARVAVNVSAEQLGKGTLMPTILDALVQSGLTPDRLEIEVTESALLNTELDSIADLRQVHDLGVRVALDDFGTGFSSLAHLRAFPFDKIKIDGSFVQDAVRRPDCAAVVHAVADLGKRLGVTTVAEGVETQAHLDRVTEEGCSEVQGYLFGRPTPSPEDAPTVARLNATAQVSAA